MARSKGKFQRYATVIVWFTTGVKRYKLTPEKVRGFVSKARKDRKVIKFVVENTAKYVY